MKNSVLYPVFDHEGRSVGLSIRGGGKALCLFSKQVLAERWLMDMGLEQHLVGRGLKPKEIARFCEESIEDGFTYALINPPIRFEGRAEMGMLESLKEQAEARA